MFSDLIIHTDKVAIFLAALLCFIGTIKNHQASYVMVFAYILSGCVLYASTCLFFDFTEIFHYQLFVFLYALKDFVFIFIIKSTNIKYKGLLLLTILASIILNLFCYIDITTYIFKDNLYMSSAYLLISLTYLQLIVILLTLFNSKNRGKMVGYFNEFNKQFYMLKYT